MSDFTIHDMKSAPAAAKPLLEGSQKTFGMIPGLHGVMAEAPALLETYQTAHRLFSNATSFDKDELTVVWQTINVENGCHYCVPAHTGIAHSMGVDASITEALRNRSALPSAKLEALRAFTLKLVRERGHLPKADIQAFLDAGFTRRQVLEVVLGYSQKVMSNYTNHLAETPVDPVFEKFVWDEKVPA